MFSALADLERNQARTVMKNPEIGPGYEKRQLGIRTYFCTLCPDEAFHEASASPSPQALR
jgi:hypothetical protein